MKAIKYLTMAVAALMMAACSNDELESAASKSGGRRALEIVPIVQGQTRAAQLTTSTLSTFYVSVTGKFCEEDGTEITNPVLTLTKNGSNWGYTYLSGSAVHNGPLYWPNEIATASFSAYTHAAGAVDEDVAGRCRKNGRPGRLPGKGDRALLEVEGAAPGRAVNGERSRAGLRHGRGDARRRCEAVREDHVAVRVHGEGRLAD